MDFITQTIESFTSQFGTFLPKVLGALAILIVGMFVVKVISGLIRKGLERSGVDNLMSDTSTRKLSASIAKIIYYLLLIYVLVLALNVLGLDSVLTPLKEMMSKIMNFIPNLIGAGLIGFIGFMIANIVKEGVTTISKGLHSVAERYGVSNSINFPSILGQLSFIFVLIPILLVALDTLNFDMISVPAKQMLTTFLDSVPSIVAAALILTLFVILAKFISKIAKDLIAGLNLDDTVGQLGMKGLMGNNGTVASLSEKVIYFYIVLFGIITAADKLAFSSLSDVLNKVLYLSGNILFGAAILLLGNRVSKWVSDYFMETNAPLISTIARFATLGLFLAISLKYMGIADEIVNLAFGLTLGSVAVAFALSFGLGGRAAAGKQMERFFDKINKK